MINKDLLEKLDIKVDTIKKLGKVTIINDKYVLKEMIDNKFYDYLRVRNFKNFPSLYTTSSNSLILMDYIKDKHLPKEQRLEDIAYLASILHLNTSYDKIIDIDK